MTKKINTVVLGTELKIKIHIDPFENLHMSDYDFECKFYVFPKNFIIIKKEDMASISEDDYLALVDTTTLGKGMLHLTVTAYIPDSNFENKIRREIKCVNPNIEIVNC